MKERKFKVALIDSSIPFSLSGDLLEPIGVCYLSSYLSQHGFDAKVFHQFSGTSKKTASEVVSWNPDVVGISFMTCAVPQASELAKLLKAQLRCPIIAGGVHVSFDSSVINNEYFDFLIRGEGEITLLKLCIALSEKGDIESIPDLLLRDNQNWGDIKNEELIPDLNQLPFPDRHDLPMDQYAVFTLFDLLPEEQRLASIQASRGCNHCCTFCTSPLLWRKRMRFRSKDSLVQEIGFLQEQYKINVINFRDENFTNDPDFLNDVCDIMEGRGISWYSFARIDELAPKVIEKMKNSGCVELFLGVESGNSTTLEAVKKGITLDQIRETCQTLHSFGIRNSIFLVIGFPWETKDSLQKTRDLVLSLPYDRVRIAIATPFPGTSFYNDAIKNNLFITNDLSLFDTEHPVLKTKIPINELIQFRGQLVKDLYLSDSYKKRCNETITRKPEMAKSYDRWFAHVKRVLIDGKNAGY